MFEDNPIRPINALIITMPYAQQTGAPPNGAVIETKSLTKTYGAVKAVEDLSLSVPRGGVFGLLGPNGSGKTTTMGMLLGLVKPSGGSFNILGHEGAAPAVLRNIGAIIETPSFYPYLSGRDNLCFFQGLSVKGSKDEIDGLLKKVDLFARANSKYSTYSLGMKQRLGIAYALLGDPELVFLDEPTNGLDPAGVAEVRDLIIDLGSGGRTVILSSHILHEVEMVCESVAILSKGRLITQGRVKDLLAHKDAFQLKTTDDNAAVKVLGALEWVESTVSEDGQLIVKAPLNRSWEVSRSLAESGVYIHKLSPVTVSLEEYFLGITGEETQPALRDKEKGK